MIVATGATHATSAMTSAPLAKVSRRSTMRSRCGGACSWPSSARNADGRRPPHALADVSSSSAPDRRVWSWRRAAEISHQSPRTGFQTFRPRFRQDPARRSGVGRAECLSAPLRDAARRDLKGSALSADRIACDRRHGGCRPSSRQHRGSRDRALGRGVAASQWRNARRPLDRAGRVGRAAA